MGWVHNFKTWVCLKIECLKSWCFIGYIGLSVLSLLDNAIPHFQRDPFPPLPHGLLQCWRNGESRANAHQFRIHTHLKRSRDQKHRLVYELWAPGVSLIMGLKNVVQKWIYNGISNLDKKPEMGMAEDLVPQECAKATCRAAFTYLGLANFCLCSLVTWSAGEKLDTPQWRTLYSLKARRKSQTPQGHERMAWLPYPQN